VKYSPKISWHQSPARRITSLFVTVILLATVLQPCVMASVVDSNSLKAETHQMDHEDGESDSGKHGCAHCDTAGCGDNQCDSEASHSCDANASYAFNERIEPGDDENFSSQHQPLKLLNNPECEIQSGQLMAPEIGRSPPISQGPKLADLYQVYLK
jgi:hypothetical protein